MKISVILCTHNPRGDYLKKTLRGLSQQTLAATEWEFVLVDNASSPPVMELHGWSSAATARVVREEQPGLTPARLRGIQETRNELLVFVDDDNVFAPDYLEQALKLNAAFPQIAVWSGHIEPEFEQPPPTWSKCYWHFLALREVKRNVWSNSYSSETLPIGAGMVVSRKVAESYAHQTSIQQGRINLDRQGNSLLAGGDTDIGYAALDLGYGCGIARELQLKHLIPPGRLQEKYLINLAQSVTYSHTLLSLLRGLTHYNEDELFRQRLRYLWYLRHRDGYYRHCRRAIVAGRIAAMKDFRRQHKD